MNCAIALAVLLFGNEVHTFTSPLLRNRVYTVTTQEQLIKNRIQTLTAYDTFRLNPRLQPRVPQLPSVYRQPVLPRLPLLPRYLPTVKSPYLNNVPMLKNLPAILTIKQEEEIVITPPKIQPPPSALQALLKSAASRT